MITIVIVVSLMGVAFLAKKCKMCHKSRAEDKAAYKAYKALIASNATTSREV